MSGTRTQPPLPEPAAASAAAQRSRRPGRRARPLARVAANPALAWGVALVLALALGVVAVFATPVLLEARDRERVAEVAALAAARLTTYDAGDLDRWADGLQEISTAAYADELTGLLDEQLRADLAEAGVSSRGEVSDVFVQRVDVPEASAFAVVRQVTVGTAQDEPVATAVRMTVHLRRVGSDWRLDGIDVLAGGAPAPLDVPGAGAEGSP